MENPDTNSLEICNGVNHCNAIDNSFTAHVVIQKKTLHAVPHAPISCLTINLSKTC